MKSKRKVKVFVSYSRHDEELIKPLAAFIGVGASDAVFLDVTSLKPGEKWEEEIVSAVKQAPVFVLRWCCNGEKSTFITKEISTALADEQKRVVPVRLCPAELPSEVAEWQWIDLRGKVVHVCTVDHGSHAQGGTEGSTQKEPSAPPRVRLPGAVAPRQRSPRTDGIAPQRLRSPKRALLPSALLPLVVVGIFFLMLPIGRLPGGVPKVGAAPLSWSILMLGAIAVAAGVAYALWWDKLRDWLRTRDAAEVEQRARTYFEALPKT